MSGSEVTVSKSQSLAFKVAKAAELLQSHQEVTITAINSAISAAINLVELLKHRIKGLHQENKFERIQDTNKTRVIIKLSFNELSAGSKGYQKPIPVVEVQEKTLEEMKKLPWEGTERNEERRGESRGRWRRSRRAWRGAPRSDETKGEVTKDEGDKKKEETRQENSERRVWRSRRGGRRGPWRGRGRQDRGGFVPAGTRDDDNENRYRERRFRRGPSRRRGDRRPPRSAPRSE
ncbi:hypothetical protein SteCoe_32811 [Stentor coeruleus]|uniref:DNA/RNA-binding protein Alba-like domain-containing protein n=1 Tax=Stentor coeruleus TaxID=5963 RepID=A0A1R2AY51_9CILI|nr:hypothetical protein SteCoe_32811 [Stentor coeruleus]